MKMKSLAVVFICAVFTLPVFGQQSLTMKLWPNGAPGTPTTKEAEASVSRPADVRGPITRITNVTDPTLTLYRPASPNRTALLVFPGGGYRWLSTDIEGSEVCDRFTREGITCLVIKYRVPQPDNSTRFEQPLQDAQRAVSLVRLHAKEWNIQPDRIGVIGFSAGAHTVAALSNHSQRTYPAHDEADQQTFRPDFAVVMYPGYLNSSKQDGTVAPEVQPSANTPPSFVFQAEDDPVHVRNSLAYYTALKDAGVPAELHIYPKGGHGYGLRANNRAAEAWPTLVMRWLESLQMVGSTPGGK